MSQKHNRRFLWFSLICIILIIGEVVRFSAVEPLKVRSRVAAYGVPANESTGVGSISVKQYLLPYSFEVGRVNSLTMHDVLLHSAVAPGLVLFGFESLEPVDCWVVLGDESSWGSDSYDNVLVNISGCHEYYGVLDITERGVLSFCFKTDTDTLSHVTLMGVSDPQFTRHNDVSDEISDAVDTARVFLSLNGVDVGKYLSYTVEQGEPNYYWQKEFH
ncbi:MAG: hypothetical protein NWF07_07950, partial [Candidatus Bathyarchaeota archaeon]|nr:hypothetical protein [Candidatus Bathyarchaeota archaeon]